MNTTAVIETSEYVELMKKRAVGDAPEMESAKHMAALMSELLGTPKRLSVLDVGCATGHYLHSIRKRFEDAILTYTGIDLDENMVMEAKKIWRGVARVRFFKGSGDQLDSLPIALHDVVFSANAFMYFPNVRKALMSLIGVTRKVLFIRSYFCEQTYIIQRAQPKEWHPQSNVLERDILDEFGMPRIHDYWNIYSYTVIESIVKEICPAARVSWRDDLYQGDFVLDEKRTGVEMKREATTFCDNHQVVYPIILPWKTLVVEI
jgi:ubiquinone/menaquinone biosynthesis C-methylase UbiE